MILLMCPPVELPDALSVGSGAVDQSKSISPGNLVTVTRQRPHGNLENPCCSSPSGDISV